MCEGTRRFKKVKWERSIVPNQFRAWFYGITALKRVRLFKGNAAKREESKGKSISNRNACGICKRIDASLVTSSRFSTNLRTTMGSVKRTEGSTTSNSADRKKNRSKTLRFSVRRPKSDVSFPGIAEFRTPYNFQIPIFLFIVLEEFRRTEPPKK